MMTDEERAQLEHDYTRRVWVEEKREDGEQP